MRFFRHLRDYIRVGAQFIWAIAAAEYQALIAQRSDQRKCRAALLQHELPMLRLAVYYNGTLCLNPS